MPGFGTGRGIFNSGLTGAAYGLAAPFGGTV
jgi:hypothetical protein